MKAQQDLPLEILQLHLLMIHGKSWSNQAQIWLEKERQDGKLLLSTTAWEILCKQPGKKQSHVPAIGKDNRRV